MLDKALGFQEGYIKRIQKHFQRVKISASSFAWTTSCSLKFQTEFDPELPSKIPIGGNPWIQVKLLCALTYLSGGVSYRHRMFSSRLPRNSLSTVMREVCTAIHEEYETEVVKCPSTPEEWKAIRDGFQRRWQFPHCLGAIDGKHVLIPCPNKGGSMFLQLKRLAFCNSYGCS